MELQVPYEWNGHEKSVGGKSKFGLGSHVISVTWKLLNRKPFNVLKKRTHLDRINLKVEKAANNF